MAKTIQITLKRSFIGHPKTQKVVANTLGLRKINQTVTHNDNAAIRGMVDKISHLVEVSELNE